MDIDEPLPDDDYTKLDVDYFIWYNKLPFFPNIFTFHYI